MLRISNIRVCRFVQVSHVPGCCFVLAAVWSMVAAAKAEHAASQEAGKSLTIEYHNPVWDGYLADPHVLKTRGRYYAYGTGAESGGRRFPVLHSKDFATWEFIGNALESVTEPALKDYWAPEVAEHDGSYYLYYAGDGRMRVAISDHPAGPFKDTGSILFPDEPFSIDGHPYRDPQTGKWYLFFAKDFLDKRVGTALAVVRLGDDMISTTGPIHTVLRAVGDWQIYQRDRKMYGQVFDAWHTVEGPAVVFRDHQYYCFYSGGNWRTPGYGVGFAVSDSVMGPYRDTADIEGPAVLKSIPGKLIGPGHNSIVLGPDDTTWFIVYHSWNAARTRRQMCLDPIQWTPQGPKAYQPSRGTKRITLPLASRPAPAAAGTQPATMPAFGPAAQRLIPPPNPVRTSILVGAHNCPLWEAGAPEMWDQVVKHPERTPALGFYDQANPEVADWETKWAVEHGINFFVYCWYRASKGDAIETRFSSAIDALMKSRFVGQFKFAIMWENQGRDPVKWGRSGVSGEKDLLQNLMPFWLTHYFAHPSYLKIDGKPLLFVYDAHKLAGDLGGARNVPKAFEQMREACRHAGFPGLYILGEYRGLDPKELRFRKDLGFDYTFAYVWPVTKPEQAVPMQLDYIRKTRELGILPSVFTVSQGWTGWRNEGPLYRIPPLEFEGLLRQVKDIIASMPEKELGSKLLLLDCWNEWSEGHYLAPHRQYGFGYLDAVRRVFSNAEEQHTDLLPKDIGLGPYDSAYRAAKRR